MDVKSIRDTENLHILLWLLKDLAWVSDFKLLGVIMILPTVAVAIYLTFKSKSDFKELMHNFAVVCWICANSIWMLGEFFFNDSLRPIATIFFVCGLASIAIFYGQKMFKKK